MTSDKWDVEWLRKPCYLKKDDHIHVVSGGAPLHQTVASDGQSIIDIGNHYEVGIDWIAKVFPELFAIMVSQRLRPRPHKP